MPQKYQSVKPQRSQRRSSLEQSTTKTSAEITSLTPPAFNLKAQKLDTEKLKGPEISETTTGKHIFASSADASPNDIPVSNPTGGNGNNGITQRKQAFSSFQAPIQKKAAVNTPPPFTSTIQRKSSNNNNIPEDIRSKMENAFKADFSNVSIHQNSQNATKVGALAYAQGNSVHFAPGQFNPSTISGQELLGHELAHVVQQRAGRVKATTQTQGMAVNDDVSLEREADNMGRRAARQQIVTPQAATPSPVSTKAAIQRKTPTITNSTTVQFSLFGNEDRPVRTYSRDSDGNHFTVNDPDFDPSRMADEFPGREIQGAGDPELAAAMQALYTPKEGEEIDPALRTQQVDAALQTISRIRGGSFEEFKGQYTKAMEIRAAGEAYARENHEREHPGKAYEEVSPNLDLEKHPNFTGSQGQLQYGSVMGDVFGIDPVFGSLLNPTGGIVGPGNDSLMDSDSDPNHPVVLHGSVHDAAGYLKNAHGIGPGYNYLKKSWELDETNPYSGQVSGIDYWLSNSEGTGGGIWNILSAKTRAMTDVAGGLVNGAKDIGGGLWNGAKDIGGGLWNGGKNILNGNFSDGLKDIGGGLWNGAKDISGGLWNGAKSLGGGLWDGVKTYGSGMYNGARKIGTNLWNGAKDVAGGVWDGAKDVGGGLWDGAKSIGGGLWNGGKNILNGNFSDGLKDIGGGLWNGTKDVGGGLWDGLKSVGGGIAKGAKTVGGGIWDTAKAIGGNLWGGAKNLGKKAGGWLGGKAKSLWGGAKSLGKKALGGAKNLGKKAWGGMKKAGGWLGGKAKSLWGGAKSLGKKALGGAKNLGRRALGGAKKLGKKAWGGVKSAGKSALKGLKKLKFW